MKTKIPLLVAAALLITSVSMAQYGGGYARTHVVVQGQVVLPGVAVGYGFDNGGYGYAKNRDYDDRRDWRDRDHDRYDRHENRRERREDEYERYCRMHREYRGDRWAYYHRPWGCR